mmetsp:Transcript_80034/g.214216  ORF Transcript_80034/g.214216 Transcript_80034/m.214216 type:complete len:419 (+) Transcript_80034:692-1948(+)
MHTTSSSGCYERCASCGGGDGCGAWPGGWLHHSFRGLDGPAHGTAVHDGRYASARGDERPAAGALLVRGAGRGARAHRGHGRALRPYQGGGAPAAGPAAGGDERHARRGQVPAVLQRLPASGRAGPHLPRRDLLHPGGGAGLPGGGDPHGGADPPVRAAGRHPRLPHGRGGDRAGVQQDRDGAARPEGDGGGASGVRAALLGAAAGGAAEGLRPRAGAPRQGRPPRAQDRGIDQHRRDIAHHRRHRLRHRPRLQQAEGVQPAHPSRVAAGHGHLPGVGQPARGACGTHAARQVLPALHAEGLPEGAAGADLPRDAAVQPGVGGAHPQEAGHRRPGALRLHGPPRARDAHARPRAPQLPRGAQRRRGPDGPRCHHGRRARPERLVLEAASPETAPRVPPVRVSCGEWRRVAALLCGCLL